MVLVDKDELLLLREKAKDASLLEKNLQASQAELNEVRNELAKAEYAKQDLKIEKEVLIKRVLSERQTLALSQAAVKKLKDDKQDLEWEVQRQTANAKDFLNQTITLKKQLTKREPSLFEVRKHSNVPVESNLIYLKQNNLKQSELKGVELSQRIDKLNKNLFNSK